MVAIRKSSQDPRGEGAESPVAALYCRLSRRPDDNKPMTLAEQERSLRREAETRGLTVGGVFADTESAFKGAKRPGFVELVAAIERGGIDFVLLVAIDRAARRIVDLAAIMQACETHGTRIVANGREYDPDDDALALYLTGIVGEQESRDKRRRVLAAKAVSLERGTYAGGRRPIGFRKIDGAARGYWQQDPAEAAAIRDGADAILNGASLLDVATDWNARGLRTSSAENPWTVSKVRRALSSPIVAGLRTSSGNVVGPLKLPNGAPWPAILTPEERDRVDRVLRSRYGTKPPRWHTKRPALLSGIIRCDVCGYAMTPRRYGGTRPDAYSCGADGARCGTVSISLPQTEAFVTELFFTALEDAGVTMADVTARHDERAAAARQASEAIDALRLELDDLAALVGSGGIPVREWQAARRGIEERLADAERLRDADETAAALAPLLGDTVDPRERWVALELDDQRRALAAMFTEVRILPTSALKDPPWVPGGPFDRRRVDPKWAA